MQNVPGPAGYDRLYIFNDLSHMYIGSLDLAISGISTLFDLNGRVFEIPTQSWL